MIHELTNDNEISENSIVGSLTLIKGSSSFSLIKSRDIFKQISFSSSFIYFDRGQWKPVDRAPSSFHLLPLFFSSPERERA